MFERTSIFEWCINQNFSLKVLKIAILICALLTVYNRVTTILEIKEIREKSGETKKLKVETVKEEAGILERMSGKSQGGSHGILTGCEVSSLLRFKLMISVSAKMLVASEAIHSLNSSFVQVLCVVRGNLKG